MVDPLHTSTADIYRLNANQIKLDLRQNDEFRNFVTNEANSLFQPEKYRELLPYVGIVEMTYERVTTWAECVKIYVNRGMT